MGPRTTRRNLSRKIIASIMLAAVLALVALAGLVTWTIATVDSESVARQTRFVSRGLVAAVAALPKEQQSSAIWDDAVLRVRSNDQTWIEENLGLWMGTYFGHDRVYVLSPVDLPIHAMVDQATVDPSVFAAESSAITPLVRKLREEMRAASPPGEDSTAAIADLGAEDFVLLNGGVALVSVLPILPSSAAVTQIAGSEYLHVSVQLVDETFLRDLAGPFELEAPRLVLASGASDPGPAAPITNQQGRILAFVQWDAYRPGNSTIVSIAPAAMAVVLAGMGLLFWLIARLRKSSTELEASEAQAQYLAFHDVLTGLPNRALFEDRLARALLGTVGDRSQCALLMVDVDRFKNINDTLGHPAGDDLIRQAGRRIADIVRDVDTVARLGGDEFAVVLPSIKTDQDAELLGARLVSAFAKPFELSGELALVSVSVGIVVTGGTPTTPAEMQRKADIALYDAKARGGLVIRCSTATWTRSCAADAPSNAI